MTISSTLKKRDLSNLLNQKYFRFILYCVMVLIMTVSFWKNSDPGYQNDSEGLVVSVIDAGKYGLELPNRKFGLGSFVAPELNDPYMIYADPSLLDQGFAYSDYESQLGLHGWIFSFLAKFVPHPMAAFRLFNCFMLAIVLSWISLELRKKFGLLLALCFYFVSLFSFWVTTFAPNLYWMEFTWFIPMLLGLICQNNPSRRFWIYPLIFLSVAMKAAMGYEFMPVVMLGSILFLVVEWLLVFNKDKTRRKMLFRTIVSIGVICILAFGVVLTLQASIKGGGDIQGGLTSIYQHDIQRRTFGNANDFTYNQMLMDSLNASILEVVAIYLWVGTTGKLALAMLVLSVCVILVTGIKNRMFPAKDTWLLAVSFIFSSMWFILGKSHSYIHTDINIIMWYMGFMQISFYIVIKFILTRLSSIRLFKTTLAPLLDSETRHEIR